jgi:hypothetical protein
MTKTATKPFMAGISMPSFTARKRAMKANEPVKLGKQETHTVVYTAPASPHNKTEKYVVYNKIMEDLMAKRKVNQTAMFGAILVSAIESVEFDKIYAKAARKLGWRYNMERDTLLFNAVNKLINSKHLIVVDKDTLITAPTPTALVCIGDFIKFKSKKK